VGQTFSSDGEKKVEGDTPAPGAKLKTGRRFATTCLLDLWVVRPE